MWSKVGLAVVVVLALMVAACGGELATPTSTPPPPRTATPTAPTPPTATPEPEGAAALTEADQAYMRWLIGVHGSFDDTAQGLIDRWQASEEAGPGELPEGTVEEMESLVRTLRDYVEEVEGRGDVPSGVAEIHAALLNEAHHWETAAPLLVEGVAALEEGDQELFLEKAEAADERMQAAVAAREKLLEASNALLQVLKEGAAN